MKINTKKEIKTARECNETRITNQAIENEITT
jgi:hypothetical protein